MDNDHGPPSCMSRNRLRVRDYGSRPAPVEPDKADDEGAKHNTVPYCTVQYKYIPHRASLLLRSHSSSSRTSMSGAGADSHDGAAQPAPRPTVLYDAERSGSADLLEPPDVNSILDRRRQKSWHSALRLDLPRSIQAPLTCFCICVSALQANGVYVWPT